MKYIKLFDTHTEYETFTGTSEFILPNVSFCVDTPNEVHYNPYVDPYNGHDYVEIAGTKWATMNIGANSVTDYGLYFQWGDTQGYTAAQCGSGDGKKYFGWADYKYSEGGSEWASGTLTKYNNTDSLPILELSDDAARANWGGEWRMPTNVEFTNLGGATTSAWTTDYQDSGVAGVVLTSKADSSKVLFPAASVCERGSANGVGSYCFYWSNRLIESAYKTNAYCMGGYKGVWSFDNNYGRGCGLSVRAVID